MLPWAPGETELIIVSFLLRKQNVKVNTKSSPQNYPMLFSTYRAAESKDWTASRHIIVPNAHFLCI